MLKAIVIGSLGAGKSTFARKLNAFIVLYVRFAISNPLPPRRAWADFEEAHRFLFLPCLCQRLAKRILQVIPKNVLFL